MSNNQVFFNPHHKMVFEGAFDDLMKEIWGDKFMYVSSWKVIGERLIHQEKPFLPKETL